MYPVDLREALPRRVVGVGHQGAYNQIGPAFRRLSELVSQAGLWPQAIEFLGVYLDNSAEVPEVDLRAMAGIAVSDDLPLPEGMQQMRLAGGRVAVLRMQGPYEGLPAAWDWFYGGWLPQSGEVRRDAPSLEVYLNAPGQVAPEHLLTEIHMPLV